MPDEETREEPEVEGHGVSPGEKAEGNAGGTSPGVDDDESEDVEAHMFGEGVSPGGVGPGGVSPGGVGPGGHSGG